ncbi:MAG TPA: ADOP family duplicated permease [Rudaea sp.]|nr:ADOP family duplicated permease [Rudaea sp.]
MFSALIYELRQGLRSLSSHLGFSALVVGVLASGLACVMFMLVMINGLVLRPLPFPEPDRLLHAGVTDGSNDGRLTDVSGRDLLELRRRLADMANVAGYESATVNLSDLDRPERFDGAMISANLGQVLGVAPILGRDFNESDEQAGAPAVVLLSHTLWQSRYGGDPGIIGRQIRVNTRPTTVVGIMPAGMSYPYREVVWIPATLREDVPDPENSYVVAMRVHAGVDKAAIATALEAWRNDAARVDPERFRGLRAGVESLSLYTINRTTRIVLGIMLAAVVLVLLVACANAANLLLLRTLSRRQELAVRVALGASRSRVALHLLAQSLLLALIATAVALPLATLAMKREGDILRSSPNGVADWLRFDLDWNLIAMAIGAALLTAVATGLLPALRASRDSVSNTLRDGSRGTTGGSFMRWSRVLVIGEVAMSCALLIVVGTMIRGIVTLDRMDLGFDSSRLLSARVALFTSTYPTGADQVRLYEKLTDRLRGDPEVVDASVATTLPMRFGANRDILPAGVAADGDIGLPKVRYGAADDHFVSTYGLHMLRGRFFDARDTSGAARVAVVDAAFAQRYFEGGDVVGRQFRLDPRSADGPSVTIIGVISPLKLDAPGDEVQPVMLAPLRQDPARFVSLVVHTRGDPNAFAPRLNAIMHEVDADTPLYWVRDFAAVIAEATFGEHVVAQLFGVFGIIALILAGAGLYGITAFSVGQRTREIGVRRALGAPATGVLRSLFARTGWQLGLGLAAGLALGIPLARVLTGTLHSISADDIATPLVALTILIAAATFAVIVPARRALRIDPTEALRYE